MATFKWAEPTAISTLLSTEMNSLGNGSNKITTTAHDNTGANNRYMYADFEFYIAEQASARSAGAFVALYILPSVDGTNFAYGGDSLDPASDKWRANFQFDAVVTARYGTIEGILLPNAKFHVLVMNETGQAFAASGNTLKMVKYNTQSA